MEEDYGRHEDQFLANVDQALSQWTPNRAPEPRRRNRNFSDREKQLLLDGVEAYFNTIKDPSTSNSVVQTRDELWYNIAQEVTALGYAYRNAEDIKQKWIHWSSEVRRKLARIRATSKEMDEECIDDNLTVLERRVRALVEDTSVRGAWNRSISGGVGLVQVQREPHPSQEYQQNLQIKQEIEYENQSHQEDNQQHDQEHEDKPTNRDIEECIRELKRKQFSQKQRRKGYQIKRRRVLEEIPGTASQGTDSYTEDAIYENGLEEDSELGDDTDLLNNQAQEIQESTHQRVSIAQRQEEILNVTKEISETLKLLLQENIKMNAQLGELLSNRNNKS